MLVLSVLHVCMQIASNKRYAGNSGWTVSETAEKVAKDIGKIDIVVSTSKQAAHATDSRSMPLNQSGGLHAR